MAKNGWWSDDGANWHQATNAATAYARDRLGCVVFDGKIWIMGGTRSLEYRSPSKNDVWWSSNGVNWTRATDAAAFAGRYGHCALNFDSKMWVIGGKNNSASTSDESSGDANDIWFSTNGIDWSQVHADEDMFPQMGLSGLVYDNKMWIIGGSSDPDNSVWSSTNGQDWTHVFKGWPSRYHHSSAVMNDQLWLIGGNHRALNGPGRSLNDVWKSDDGTTWTEATAAAAFPPRCWHTSLAFNNRLWVIGGLDPRDENDAERMNDVWSSSDGTSWTQVTASAPFAPRFGHSSVVFDGKMWVIGGATDPNEDYQANPPSEVWFSDNGTTWTQAVTNRSFHQRMGHTSLAYRGKIWVIGGTGSTYPMRTDPEYMAYNDVWCSGNGRNWTQVTDQLFYYWLWGGYVGAENKMPLREDFSSAVFDDRMWIIGSGWQENDAWWSTDGRSWFQATCSPAFTARSAMTCEVFMNRLWILGGFAVPGASANDVWSTDVRFYNSASSHWLTVP